MVDWNMLQELRFYYAFKGQPQHPELVKLAKEHIGGSVKFKGLDLLDILISAEKENPHYPEALEMYRRYYGGMSNEELLEFSTYLQTEFGLKRTNGSRNSS